MDPIRAMNTARLSQNSTGFGGVRRVRCLYQARVTVTVDGRSKRIQSQGFDTKQQAASWRQQQIDKHEGSQRL
jgi:hypothetical protein